MGSGLVLALLFAPPAAAQVGPEGGAGLGGLVVDASSGAPLEGATVTLEVVPLGVVAGGDPGGGGLVSVARRTVTGEDGGYRFAGLGPGAYRLRVVRIGYRSATLDVRYDGPADPRVSVGLIVEPVELEPLEVVGSRPAAFVPPGRARPGEEGDARVAAERLRQQRFLQPDSRVLSRDDMVEAVTIGETDLLRALHRLPGVAAADDWSAEPWTRGARWDETRVYFDGIPLFDPVHVGGAFTSLSPDGIGALTFHPGVHPAEVPSAATGVVDLRSRPATGAPNLSALAQASLLSGRLAIDRPLGGGSGIAFSARRSYIEEITRQELEAGRDGYVPLRFHDVTARWDQRLTDSLHLEVSGLSTEDRILGDFSHELKGTRARWGNQLLRLSLEYATHGVRLRFTEGDARYRAEVQVVPFDPGRTDLADAVTGAPLFNQLDSELSEITVTPATAAGALPPWQVGVQQIRSNVDYEGPAPWPFPASANAGTLRQLSEVRRFAAWGRVRRSATEDVAMEAGLRVDSDSRDPSKGTVELAPRLALTWTPDPELRVSVAAGRQIQYEQALAGAGFVLGPALVPAHLWVTASGSVPAIRAGVLTAGAELWLPGGVLASANAYLRRSTGHLTPAPDSGFVRAVPPVEGELIGGGWASGETRAVGLELGARKLAGRWTGSFSYSLSRARLDAGGVSFPAPGERTHVVDASLLVRVGRGFRLGGVYTAASGAPFTRFFAFRCPGDRYCPAGDGPPVIGFKEPAGAERAPAYASLDLLLEKEGSLLGLPFGFYAQVRNVFGRDNRSAYLGSVLRCDDSESNCSVTDRFDDGLPRLPLLGFWLRL